MDDQGATPAQFTVPPAVVVVVDVDDEGGGAEEVVVVVVDGDVVTVPPLVPGPIAFLAAISYRPLADQTKPSFTSVFNHATMENTRTVSLGRVPKHYSTKGRILSTRLLSEVSKRSSVDIS